MQALSLEAALGGGEEGTRDAGPSLASLRAVPAATSNVRTWAGHRQAFPLGQAHTPLTSMPTLGRALTDGSLSEVDYVNTFLQRLAQHSGPLPDDSDEDEDDTKYEEEEPSSSYPYHHRDDHDDDDDDYYARRKRRTRWRPNYPKIKKPKRASSSDLLPPAARRRASVCAATVSSSSTGGGGGGGSSGSGVAAKKRRSNSVSSYFAMRSAESSPSSSVSTPAAPPQEALPAFSPDPHPNLPDMPGAPPQHMMMMMTGVPAAPFDSYPHPQHHHHHHHHLPPPPPSAMASGAPPDDLESPEWAMMGVALSTNLSSRPRAISPSLGVRRDGDEDCGLYLPTPVPYPPAPLHHAPPRRHQGPYLHPEQFIQHAPYLPSHQHHQQQHHHHQHPALPLAAECVVLSHCPPTEPSPQEEGRTFMLEEEEEEVLASSSPTRHCLVQSHPALGRLGNECDVTPANPLPACQPEDEGGGWLEDLLQLEQAPSTMGEEEDEEAPSSEAVAKRAQSSASSSDAFYSELFGY